MGNYSRDPQAVLDDARTKGYTRVLFQQAAVATDFDLNLALGLSGKQSLAQNHFGNGVPLGSNGFLISDLNVAGNDFTIAAGRCLVDGYEVVLSENTTYQTQPHTENVAALAAGKSNVYLRVFTSEVTQADDPDLANDGDVGFETSVRERVELEVLISQNIITDPAHLLLAEIDTDADTIEDRRRTNLTLASIRDELVQARGDTSHLSERLDASLAEDGTLNDNSVREAQIADDAVTSTKILDGSIRTDALADNAVTGAKLQSHPSDNALRAVGKEHIQDGAASMAQLSTSLVFDAEVSVPAAPGAGTETESAVILEQLDEHAFHLISVRYVSPRPPLAPAFYFSSFKWTRRNSLFKPPGRVSIFFHRHEVLIQNPHTIAITVAIKAYRLFES